MFSKGYYARFTEEVFQVAGVDKRKLIPIYTLVDLAGEPIEGRFYDAELVRVNKPETFVIDRIIKSRKTKARGTEYLVSWAGYPASFNSWEPADQL